MAVRTIPNNLNDVLVLQSLKDLDLLLHSLDRILVSLQELFTQKLEGYNLVGILETPGLIHLGSVAFSK